MSLLGGRETWGVRIFNTAQQAQVQTAQPHEQ